LAPPLPIVEVSIDSFLGCRLLFDNPIDQQRIFIPLLFEPPFGTFELFGSGCLASFLEDKMSKSHDLT
jgi:hypothetical protein